MKFQFSADVRALESKTNFNSSKISVWNMGFFNNILINVPFWPVIFLNSCQEERSYRYSRKQNYLILVSKLEQIHELYTGLQA